jgi:hypothetical protein
MSEGPADFDILTPVNLRSSIQRVRSRVLLCLAEQEHGEGRRMVASMRVTSEQG